MHITSLPSEYGIGTLGKEAIKFADFLSKAGQKYWQVLPLGPTGLGNSPYSSFSTFAGNNLLIDIEMLIEDGVVSKAFVDALPWGDDPEKVDFETVRASKDKVLLEAFKNGYEKEKSDVEAFKNANAWLKNYALFMTARELSDGAAWTEWDEPLRRRDPEALRGLEEEYGEKVNYYTYVQYIFFRQWAKFKAHVEELGIKIIGDMPMYVAMDSADTWCEPQFFQMDDDFVPSHVAGVPPDYFSEEGQLWGNPLYDWDAMKNDGYGWWIRRVEGAVRMFDVIRIDHFRAFASYWSVPADAETAKTGEWVKGPGMDLLGVLKNWFYGTEYIAEDLGILTPDVNELLEISELPGMNILEFAFTEDASSKYMPHRITENAICYTGTHDNDTVLGWWLDETVAREDRTVAALYLGLNEDEKDAMLISRAFIRAGLGTKAVLAIAQMQDWLALDTSARMNVPGVALGNWSWRMKQGAADDALADEMHEYTAIFSRL